MAINKNKISALAQKYATKGQFEKALNEYKKLLSEDSKDIRTWLKMGDLYTRMGARKEATETYLKVAQYYKDSGFHLKAIAIYKQVLKLDPTKSQIYKFLGDAYLSLGLLSEAMIQFEQLADSYSRAGNFESFLNVLFKMSKIDEKNISIRLRIAEQLSKDGKTGDAVAHFSFACDQLREQGRTDDYLKVAKRLLFHDSSQIEVTIEVAAIYIDRKQYKLALAKLQLCFSKDPRNIVTLDLLASAFLGLGQPDKAVSVYEEIVNIIKEQGGTDKEKNRFSEAILNLDGQNKLALANLTQNTQHSNDDLPSPAAAGAIISDANLEESSMPDQELTAAQFQEKNEELLEEAEVLLKYGLLDRVTEHFVKIFEFDYYNLNARERFKDILLENGNKAGAIEQLMILAEGFMEKQPEGSVYFLHQVLKLDSDHEAARKMIVSIGGIMPDWISDEQNIPTESIQEEFVQDFDLEEDDLGEEDLKKDEDLEDEDLEEEDLEEEDLEEEDLEEEDLEELYLEEEDLEEEDLKKDELKPDSPQMTIENIPYIISSDEFSELDIDDNSSNDRDLIEDKKETSNLVTQMIDSPVIESFIPVKSSELPELSPLPTPEVSPKSLSADIANKTEFSNEPDVINIKKISNPIIVDISEELEEFTFFIEQGLKDEAHSILKDLLDQYPRDSRLIELAPQVGIEIIKTAKNNDAFNLDELAGDIDFEDIIQDEVVGEIDEVLGQFKAGVENQISQSDHATHFDLGVAYKEMELFDDAILEFQISTANSLLMVSSETMIGLCQVDLGHFEKAIATFDKALKIVNLKEQETLALQYEKGKVLILQNKQDLALEIFNNILNVDPGFADVIDRIDLIKS